MGSLFSGTPQQAPSYVSTSSETPKWMQDAIYNQINWSQAVAQMPYDPYAGTLVAPSQPQQQTAWANTTQAQGKYQPWVKSAMEGTETLAGATGGATAAQPYMQEAIAANPFQAGKTALGYQGETLGNIDYSAPVSTLNPFVQQSTGMSGLAAAAPYLQSAAMGAGNAAAPTTDVSAYMNPYNQQVTDRIAQLGARNLSENLLPALRNDFIKAGQFGSARMGDFGARALRDANESILGQQAQVLQSGYGQATQAAQADRARQLQASGQMSQIGSQFGGLTQAQQQAILQGGQALSSAEQQANSQRLAGASQYGQMGQTAGNLAAQQQQAMLSAGNQAGALRNQDLSRQQSALAQMAQQAQQAQQMGYTDIAALEAAGQSQQQQQQNEANAAYQQYQVAQQYPMDRLNFLSSQVRGLAPYVPTQQTQSGYTTTFGQSPLSQLATGLATGAGLYKLMNP